MGRATEGSNESPVGERADRHGIDSTGDVNLHSSLRHILANCKDFQEEETALEHLGTQLGITVKLTPKFHAKLAGKG
jgi:hypothetical protein